MLDSNKSLMKTLIRVWGHRNLPSRTGRQSKLFRVSRGKLQPRKAHQGWNGISQDWSVGIWKGKQARNCLLWPQREITSGRKPLLAGPEGQVAVPEHRLCSSLIWAWGARCHLLHQASPVDLLSGGQHWG